MSFSEREIPERVAARAASKWVADGECWITTYSHGSHGYGQIGWSHEGKVTMTTVHRAAWVHYHDQVPTTMTVDHLCRNRACVRPDHLQLLTNSENGRRNKAAGHYPLSWSCKRDHDPDLRITLKRGSTICGACREIDRKRWREENPERYRKSQLRYEKKRALQRALAKENA